MSIFVSETQNVNAAGQEQAPPASQPSVLRRPPVLKQQMVFGAAAKAPEFSDRMRYHYRETRRIAVDIPCSVEVVEADGTIFDSGTAHVANVSPSGALLNSFALDKKSFPSASFKLRLVLKGDPYNGIGIEATPVRIAASGGLGVKFDEIFVAV